MVDGLIVPVSAVMKVLEKEESRFRKELKLEDEDLKLKKNKSGSHFPNFVNYT